MKWGSNSAAFKPWGNQRSNAQPMQEFGRPHTAPNTRSINSVTSPKQNVSSHRRSGSAVGLEPMAYDGQTPVRSAAKPVTRHVRSGSSPVSLFGNSPPAFSPYNAAPAMVSPDVYNNGFSGRGMPRVPNSTASPYAVVTSPSSQPRRQGLPTGRHPAAKSGYL